MSLYLKLGLGLATLSAFAVPGAWLMMTSEPSSVTVGDVSPTKSEYKDKFGQDFKHHLVDATSEKNKNWWDWVFKYRWQDSTVSDKEEEFKQISNGAELRDKCEEYYKKDTKTEIRAKNKEKFEKFVWTYCSLEGQKPITLEDLDPNSVKPKDASSGQNVAQKHKKDLVSTKDERNSKFWEIQEKAFFKDLYQELLGKNPKNDDSIFQKLYKENPEEDKKTLLENCEKAFTQEEKQSKKALMFCSLNPRKLINKSGTATKRK